MRKFCLSCCWILVFGVLAGHGMAQEVPEITMMYTEQSGYHPDELRMLSNVFEDLTSIRVDIDYVRYEEQYEEILKSAGAYDAFSVDQIWLADLVDQELILPLNDYIPKDMRDDITPAILNGFRYQQFIWAFPYLANFQLLYYNPEMLEKAEIDAPPTTLEELVSQMKTIKKEGILPYPWTDAWQEGEGLVCEFVWLVKAFGGSLFDKEGRPLFDQRAGIKALKFMNKLLEEGLAHPGILQHDDAMAKNDFISGQAAFTSGWTFVQGFLDAVGTKEKSEGKIALLPSSKSTKENTASVGAFQGIAISAASAQPELTWQWIRFLTSPLVQRAYLFEMPIWISVQDSPDAQFLDPWMALKKQQLAAVSTRPTIQQYQAVSQILQQHLHAALSGDMEPEPALKQAKQDIEELLELEPDDTEDTEDTEEGEE